MSNQINSLLPSGVTIIYRQALLSRTQVDTLDDLVATHARDFSAEGVQLSMWGQSALSGISYTQPYAILYSDKGTEPSANLQRAFQIFGPGTVVFGRGGVDPIDRNADTSPFYGAGGGPFNVRWSR